MTLGGTHQEWTQLLYRVGTSCGKADAREAILAITEQLFDTPTTAPGSRPVKASKRGLAKVAVDMAAGKTDSAEQVSKKHGTSQRTLWRYMGNMTLKEFQMELRRIWYLLFNLGRRRFGLMRLGYEVYIDEHQTLFFGKARKQGLETVDDEVVVVDLSDGEYTEVGWLAGAAKKDKYSGKFRALTYQVMVACFTGSRVTLPLDAVLVAKGGPMLADGIKVPSLSKEWVIDHFIGLLEALYPPPRLILFDRGYNANMNYARVGDYCARHGCRYLTPAVNHKGAPFDDGSGTTYAGLDDFIRRNRATAQPIRPGSSTFFAVSRRPVTGHPNGLRTLIVFYRLRGAGEELPEGAIALDARHFAFSFYTNEPNPTPLICWWERIYSRRWTQENWFKKRAANFHDGRAHTALRRVAIFMIGILCLAVYGLMQGLRFPVHDVEALSRQYPVPTFVTELLAALATS